jgi:hypothetical protein
VRCVFGHSEKASKGDVNLGGFLFNMSLSNRHAWLQASVGWPLVAVQFFVHQGSLRAFI